MSTRVSVRSPTTRAAALVCGVIATAGVFRLSTVLLSTLATTRLSMALATAARVSATMSAALVTMGIAAALVWVARVGRPGRLQWVVPAVVVAMAAVVTGVVLLGTDPEAGGGPLWLYRSLDQLAPRPLPFGPLLPLIAVEALRWLTAVAALTARPRSRAMGACVALALMSGGTLEIPSCAIGLVVATLALALHPRVPTMAERRALLRR